MAKSKQIKPHWTQKSGRFSCGRTGFVLHVMASSYSSDMIIVTLALLEHYWPLA